MLKGYKPKLLKLVKYSDPVLREKTKPVQFPLSLEDQKLIADMIYSIQPKQLLAAGAEHGSAAGMAANQWGINKSIFLYCPSGDTINDLAVIINPSYEPIKTHIFANHEDTEWEGCFSVPLATGNVKRSTRIKAKFHNEQGKLLELELDGWMARVWQHETDHLEGFLYDDPRAGKCLEKHTFATQEELDAFFDVIRAARK
jgi:peptide deformylase